MDLAEEPPESEHDHASGKHTAPVEVDDESVADQTKLDPTPSFQNQEDQERDSHARNKAPAGSVVAGAGYAGQPL